MKNNTYSRKQMNVVYRAFKEGNIELDQATIIYLYDHADGMGIYNTNDMQTAEALHYGMKVAVDAIFAGDYKTAQVSIENMMAA